MQHLPVILTFFSWRCQQKCHFRYWFYGEQQELKTYNSVKLNAAPTGKIFTYEKPKANIHDLTEI